LTHSYAHPSHTAVCTHDSPQPHVDESPFTHWPGPSGHTFVVPPPLSVSTLSLQDETYAPSPLVEHCIAGVCAKVVMVHDEEATQPPAVLHVVEVNVEHM
jgi:hypothetical protein